MKKLLTSLTSLTILCSSVHAQDRPERRDRPAAQRPVDLEQVKKRIEGAVERGDMTRDQANAKYTEIIKHLAARDGHQPDQKPNHDNLPREARLKMLLGRLVESKQISHEVAGQIFNLAFEGHKEGPEPRNHEHLEKLAGELQHLVERARHELEEIKNTRERLNGERHEHGENNEHRTHEQENRKEAEAHHHAEKEEEMEKRDKDKKREKEEKREREEKKDRQ